MQRLGSSIWESLTTRMILFGIVLVSTTAGLIGTLSYTRARHSLRVEAHARLTLAARDIAEHFHASLEDAVVDVTSWAHIQFMRAILYSDVDKELAEFLHQILQGRSTYRAIQCTDTIGQRVAGVGEVESIVPRPLPARPHLSVLPSGLIQIETAVADPQHPERTIGGLFALLDPISMLEPLDTSMTDEPHSISVTLRERTGEVVSEIGAASAAVRTSRPRLRRKDLLPGVAAVGRLIDADAPELEVVVAEPKAEALAASTALRTRLIKSAVFVLLLSAALGAAMAWWISLPIRRFTGTVRQISERGTVDPGVGLPAAGGEVGTLAAAFRTMMQNLALAQSETLAQSRLAFLGEIAANIAHDVRTPLSVLKTSAQLLARGELPREERRTLALNLATEVDRLNAVVTGLVDLARPRPVRNNVESIGTLAHRAATFFEPLATKSGVTVVERLPSDEVLVYGSADQLYQVLLNLIHNSLQAIAGEGTLTIECRREETWVRVDVSDTGPGFPVDALPRAFAPFATTKPDGVGLGLAIAKRIVEEHGGTIDAENVAGGGARVWFRLPLRRETAE